MIGIDLVYLPEFQKQVELGGKVFLSKTFNKQELKNKNIGHLAGIWAAKEAVFKASEIKNPKMIDIFIEYVNKKPIAVYNDKKYNISIAHHGDYAVAVAVEDKK